MPSKKQLDLYIEVDVLTPGTAAEVVNSILESLLYQRNQIPFVYKTYRYYVNKWMEEKEKKESMGAEMTGIHSFQAQRQKQLATKTKEEISAMKELIKDSFEKKFIKSLRFLFGSTTSTAKESYTIHMPIQNIATNHLHDHHRISPGKLNETLLSLLTNEDLFTTFSYNLNTTNIYLELEVLENICPTSSSYLTSATNRNTSTICQIFPKDFSPLPASCKDIHLYLLHKHTPDFNSNQLKCCKELQVFEDIMHLNLETNTPSSNEYTHEKVAKSISNTVPAWWEAEIVVRGFKDQPIKGFNLWS